MLLLSTLQSVSVFLTLGTQLVPVQARVSSTRSLRSSEHSSNSPKHQQRAVVTPQAAIDLGSASTYSVFASTGIASVEGTLALGQIITGDIGVGPIAITAITGFGSVLDGIHSSDFVSGKFYGPLTTGPNGVAEAVLSAYKSAFALPILPQNTALPSDWFVGNSNLSTPSVYQFGGTLVIGADTTVTINGKCGDFYVFITTGAISTGASSRVKLAGGLTAATVFWVTSTVMTTGVDSTFSGMILAGTNVVIAGELVGGVYSQTEVALHQAAISLPSLVCTVPCVLVPNQDKSCDAGGHVNACFAGYSLQNGICTPCSSNHYALEGDTTCTICPVDTYNVKSALTSLSDCVVDK